jgi:hypothetical protein
MVVQIDARRFTSAAIPLEDEPPLLVDADRMEACQIAAQLCEMVAGRHPQVLIRRRVVASSIIWILRNKRLSRSDGFSSIEDRRRRNRATSHPESSRSFRSPTTSYCTTLWYILQGSEIPARYPEASESAGQLLAKVGVSKMPRHSIDGSGKSRCRRGSPALPDCSVSSWMTSIQRLTSANSSYSPSGTPALQAAP